MQRAGGGAHTRRRWSSHSQEDDATSSPDPEPEPSQRRGEGPGAGGEKGLGAGAEVGGGDLEPESKTEAGRRGWEPEGEDALPFPFPPAIRLASTGERIRGRRSEPEVELAGGRRREPESEARGRGRGRGELYTHLSELGSGYAIAGRISSSPGKLTGRRRRNGWEGIAGTDGNGDTEKTPERMGAAARHSIFWSSSPYNSNAASSSELLAASFLLFEVDQHNLLVNY